MPDSMLHRSANHTISHLLQIRRACTLMSSCSEPSVGISPPISAFPSLEELPDPPLEDECRIGPAKPERVRESIVDPHRVGDYWGGTSIGIPKLPPRGSRVATWLRIERMVMPAAKPPRPPSRWPVMDFVELTGSSSLRALSPKKFSIGFASIASPKRPYWSRERSDNLLLQVEGLQSPMHASWRGPSPSVAIPVR